MGYRSENFTRVRGTGKDVSDESIADARDPLTINAFADSYITVPIGR